MDWPSGTRAARPEYLKIHRTTSGRAISRRKATFQMLRMRRTANRFCSPMSMPATNMLRGPMVEAMDFMVPAITVGRGRFSRNSSTPTNTEMMLTFRRIFFSETFRSPLRIIRQ